MNWDGARLANRLKHRHLALLLNIARHGSLTRVAAAAGISQPAVTKSLAELEDIFGASTSSIGSNDSDVTLRRGNIPE